MKDFLHHLLFPRQSNNHRPKLLHHDSLTIIICFIVFCISLFAFVQHTQPQVLGITSDISAADLLYFTNQKRQEHGLQPLKLNEQLSQAAQAKAKHMLTNNYWAHVAPDGTTPWVFIKQAGYEYLYAGENLARGFTTAASVVDAWMASPTHRENMLSTNYNDVGFAMETGFLTGSETILVVEELGSRYKAESKEVAVDTIAPTATPVVVAQIISPSPVPSVLPTSTPTVAPHHQKTSPEAPGIGVASVQNQPLLDKNSLTKQISLGVLGLLLLVLLVDAIIIERRKIARLVGHNVDHILFLTIITLVAIIIGRGVVQ